MLALIVGHQLVGRKHKNKRPSCVAAYMVCMSFSLRKSYQLEVTKVDSMLCYCIFAKTVRGSKLHRVSKKGYKRQF
jgi:hypothetical protein